MQMRKCWARKQARPQQLSEKIQQTLHSERKKIPASIEFDVIYRGNLRLQSDKHDEVSNRSYPPLRSLLAFSYVKTVSDL